LKLLHFVKRNLLAATAAAAAFMMTRPAHGRATRTLSIALAVAAVYWLGSAFVSQHAARPPQESLRGTSSAAAAAAAAAAAVAAPAFGAEEAATAAAVAVAKPAAEAAKPVAEAAEAAANRIPLGGGFAINTDIPETGLVNIVVLIAGLLYLLAPLLSESMSTREKEIQTDIDDAIAKYNEATARLAETQKAKAQADEVIAEINASIEKDQREFQTMIEAQTKTTLEKQAAAAEEALKELQSSTDLKVEAYIQEQAVKRGMKELQELSGDQKAKFMDAAIESL